MERYNQNENYYSAIALGKTVVFLLYSILIPLAVLAIILLTPISKMPNVIKDLIGSVVWVSGEIVLLFCVIKGLIPGSESEVVTPFSERQFAAGITIISFIPWLLYNDILRFQIIQVIINGSLFIGVSVFFITKSILSKKIRWQVLSVLLFPALQLLYSRTLGIS
jgi:hypothetical protein